MVRRLTPSPRSPTVWGLTPREIHDRFWASRGVQVVRPGARGTVAGARLYLLLSDDHLLLFSLSRLPKFLNRSSRRLLRVLVRDENRRGCREFTVTDDRLQLRAFRRLYDQPDAGEAGVFLTRDPALAALWRNASDSRAGLRRLAEGTWRAERARATIRGRVYFAEDLGEVMRFTRDLVGAWKRPDLAVRRARRLAVGVWADPAARVHEEVRFAGPVWIGAGRWLDSETGVAGPDVLWDVPENRPSVERVHWDRLRPEPQDGVGAVPKTRAAGYPGKRALDIVVALLLLLLTAPVWPLVMLAIYLTDGRPFFFSHRRQTFGGREFGCLKFRTMRKDAEKIKAQLMKENQVDGPQFYIANDPRMLRFGQFFRKTKIDELPQLINVLLGHMSIVGPRPSPHDENQYCPAWREARLSVRPGITGLWQVMCTRRKETDFQDWIRYDTEYVDRISLKFDLWILWRTIFTVLRGH